jgi:hypothetical protein
VCEGALPASVTRLTISMPSSATQPMLAMLPERAVCHIDIGGARRARLPAHASVRRLQAVTSRVLMSLQLRARHASTLSSTWQGERQQHAEHSQRTCSQKLKSITVSCMKCGRALQKPAAREAVARQQAGGGTRLRVTPWRSP